MILDVASEKTVRDISGYPAIMSMALSPDGSSIATGSYPTLGENGTVNRD